MSTRKLLILTGVYLAWYWFPVVVGDAPSAGRTDVAAVSATISNWLQSNTGVIAGLSTTVVLIVLLSGFLHQRRRNSGRRTEEDCCDPQSTHSPGDRPSVPTERH